MTHPHGASPAAPAAAECAPEVDDEITGYVFTATFTVSTLRDMTALMAYILTTWPANVQISGERVIVKSQTNRPVDSYTDGRALATEPARD